MIQRRDLLFGAACVAAAGGALALKPRREVSLLRSRELAKVVPTSFGEWSSNDIRDPLALNPGSLSAKLYGQLVTRVYRQASTGQEVVMLLAHGERQTDDLQLHRPEVCYPAFGYKLLRNEPLAIPLQAGPPIPSRRILAARESREEAIVYWSRIGEYLPADGGQQRRDRLRIAMQGMIPDGVLCRFSTPTSSPAESWALVTQFIVSLLGTMAADQRQVLVGSARAGVAGAGTGR